MGAGGLRVTLRASTSSVRPTASCTVRTGMVGFVAEVQPIYGLDLGAFRVRSSLGVNLHF